jgi:hypothetical protein
MTLSFIDAGVLIAAVRDPYDLGRRGGVHHHRAGGEAIHRVTALRVISLHTA